MAPTRQRMERRVMTNSFYAYRTLRRMTGQSYCICVFRSGCAAKNAHIKLVALML
jgi:hypothetical protein